MPYSARNRLHDGRPIAARFLSASKAECQNLDCPRLWWFNPQAFERLQVVIFHPTSHFGCGLDYSLGDIFRWVKPLTRPGVEPLNFDHSHSSKARRSPNGPSLRRFPSTLRLAILTDTLAAMLGCKLLAALQAISRLPLITQLWVGLWFLRIGRLGPWCH